MTTSNRLSDEDYDFIYSRSPRLCVDLIVKNDQGNTLYINRDQEPYKGYWHTPGGRVFFRETIDDAIKRIIKRETGIDDFMIVRNLHGFCEFLSEEQNGSPRHSVSIYFEIRVSINDNRFFKEMPSKFIPEQYNFLKKNGYN